MQLSVSGIRPGFVFIIVCLLKIGFVMNRHCNKESQVIYKAQTKQTKNVDQCATQRGNDDIIILIITVKLKHSHN